MYPSKLFRFLGAILAFACVATHLRANDDATQAGTVAQEFINAYVKAIPGFDDGYESAIKWVETSPLVTKSYQTALAKL